MQPADAISCISSLGSDNDMSDSSAIPVRRGFDAQQRKVKTDTDTTSTSTPPAITPAGPRKLVRPQLPAGASVNRSAMRFPSFSNLRPAYRRQPSAGPHPESSHAEAFYFQKQINTQTPMIFVLEEGEEIEGQIEWYDRDSIKIRHGNIRTLIYKSVIKYLYKAADKGLNGQL